MHAMVRRVWSRVAALCALLSVVLVPARAMAEGQAITGATPVVYGQQEFGNTANGGVAESRCGFGEGHSYRSWWELSVTAGDALTIDWETQERKMHMFLWAPGTTDFTFLQENPLVEQTVNLNFKEQATYTAKQTGIMPLDFKSDPDCGEAVAPYNFTASVLHAVVLSLPTLSTLEASGVISVGVHNPDGAPINDPNLMVGFNVLVSGGSYTAVGQAPVINGTAAIPFTIPSGDAGQSVTVEATSAGAAYLPGSSSSQIVRIAKSVSPPVCIVPSIKHNETLGRMESAIRHAHCAVGPIHRIRSRRHHRGTVISVSPKSGAHLLARTRIVIVVSRGRR